MTYQPKSGILLGTAIGVNMNTTGDQAIAVPYSRYVVRRIVVGNASVSLTLAAGGVYTAAAKGGTAIVSAAQLYSFLTAVAKFLDLTLAAILGTDVRTESILYLSLTTAQGAAATADIYVYGDILA
jgi:hypothetical protein